MQQAILPAHSPTQAKIIIPGSKSITNRAFLLAALADGVSTLSGIQISDDTLTFLLALQKLGITIQLDEKSSSCTIIGNNGEFPNKQTSLWCANAGTVARFLLVACAASNGVYHFDGSAHLCKRPIAPLLDVLRCQGAQVAPYNAQQLPLTLTGTDLLAGGDILLDSTLTSQFLSALLMIAPYARSSLTINIAELVSRFYVDMTCAMMAEFGVQVHRIHQGRFMVPVPQRYQARDYTIEPDLSTASYFLAAAAITGGEITIPAIKRSESKQADVNFLSVLEEMGCHITNKPAGLTLTGPTKLQGIEVNMCDFSDTFLTLAAIAPFASSPVKITHIGHTRYKESDRINAIKNGLEKMGVTVESGNNWIKIFPSIPHGCTVNACDDHRVAMAFSIIGLKVPNVIIEGAECVTKTCPEFFTLWNKLTQPAYTPSTPLLLTETTK
jgi:3-phosphoshikimate 1-carboxyvinyltransferase